MCSSIQYWNSKTFSLFLSASSSFYLDLAIIFLGLCNDFLLFIVMHINITFSSRYSLSQRTLCFFISLILDHEMDQNVTLLWWFTFKKIFFHNVYKNNLVSGIPGDGRCLFRSVVHGACLRAGKPCPSESIQKELADELRSKVINQSLPQ